MPMRLLCALAAIILAGCAGQHGVAAASGVEIKRSGVLAPGGPTVESVYWVDDRHVLFVGAKPGVFETLPDGRKPLKSFLMRWDTATGEVKTLAELGEYAGLCYDRGYIRYWYRRPGGHAVFKAGTLGSEVEVAPKGSINRFSCREYDERHVHSKYGPGFIPLREEHGYIGGRQDARKQNMAVYITTVDGKPGELWVPVLGAGPRWSEYAGAYVFRRSEGLFSATKTTGKMWLLKPSGESKEFEIPAGPWFSGSTGYGYTKRGVFMWSSATRAKAEGGYLIGNSLPERFIQGYIYAFGISPNGCNIALSIRLQDGASDSAEMMMANICAKGN